MGYKVRYITYDDAKPLIEESLKNILEAEHITVDITGDKDIWSLLIHGLSASHGNKLCELTGRSIVDQEIKDIIEGNSSIFYSTDRDFLLKLLYPEGGISYIFATDNGFFAIIGEESKITTEVNKIIGKLGNLDRLVSAMSMSIGHLTEAILMPEVSSYSELVSAVANMEIALKYITQHYSITDGEIAEEVKYFA